MPSRCYYSFTDIYLKQGLGRAEKTGKGWGGWGHLLLFALDNKMSSAEKVSNLLNEFNIHKVWKILASKLCTEQRELGWGGTSSFKVQAPYSIPKITIHIIINIILTLVSIISIVSIVCSYMICLFCVWICFMKDFITLRSDQPSSHLLAKGLAWLAMNATWLMAGGWWRVTGGRWQVLVAGKSDKYIDIRTVAICATFYRNAWLTFLT